MQIWMRIQEEKKFLHSLLRIFLDFVAFAIPLPPNSVFHIITDLLGGGDMELPELSLQIRVDLQIQQSLK